MNKKNAIKIMGGVCALSLIVGSFAFFTDRTTQDATATAGNIDLVFTDISAAAEHKVASQTNTLDKVWEGGKITADIMNPGDNFDMGYKLENTGSKSIDVKQQIVLVSDVALTDAKEEYKIVIAGQEITPAKSEDDKTLTYELAEIILNGTVEEDGDAAVQEYDVYLAFDRLAKNKFMNSNVTVTLDVQAKQHRNTTGTDWIDWAQYKTEVEVID